MTLTAGAKLGPYEILCALGAGGMGEVYRARDPRLGREVAIKVLPASFSSDADRLRRFEQEARAASALNHPNIVTLHDIGTNASDGAPYVVTELLEGETLRARLAGGPLSPRKATEYAIQIAQGLAAAHDKGIVHRDLKPENLFVTEDGRVKILDFGLAKLIQPEASAAQQTAIPTASPGTEPGVVMGTVGYMSPEQVKGLGADPRSDIFSFGAILYEMLAGRRAFKGDSAVETMSAILKEDPPDLSESNRSLSPGLERLVRHCLEKSPTQRFQSARDLAYDLETLTSTSGESPATRAALRGTPRALRALWISAAIVAAALAGMFLDRSFRRAQSPTFRQLTFRRGLITAARFNPEGGTVLYSALFGADPARIFAVRRESPESSPLNLPDAYLFSVSRTGELAIGLGAEFLSRLTLARVPVSGGAPREILNDVTAADWSPDGADLAVAHVVDGRTRVEYPIGKTVYESRGWVTNVRVSPKGDWVAIADHPVLGDTPGSVLVVDRSGKTRVLSSGWYDLASLAWSPSGGEVWFSANASGSRHSVWAVTLSGKKRLVAEAPGSLLVDAISPSGTVLLKQDSYRSIILGIPPGATQERDVSWLDFSYPIDLSDDGRTLLFEEWGEGGGGAGSVYLRHFDGSPPVRLGHGLGLSLSPDGKSVLTLSYGEPPRLVVLPTGAGQPTALAALEGMRYKEKAAFLPGGQQIVFAAREGARGSKLYVQDLAGGSPRAVSAEGALGEEAPISLSPDGRLVASLGPDRRTRLFPLDGGAPRPVPGVEPGEIPIRFTQDGRLLYVLVARNRTVNVFLVNVLSGERSLWREFHPDPAGLIASNTAVVLTADGRTWFCGYQNRLSELYLAEGLK